MPQIDTTKPGYDLATGDLARAHVGPLEAARIIVERSQGPGGQPDISALLAAMVKDQSRANYNYTVYPWQITTPPGIPQSQQILSSNPLRGCLWLVCDIAAPVMFFLLEPGPTMATNMTTQDFNLAVRRALRSNTFQNSSHEFEHTPTNAVTILVNGGLTTNGIVIEGL